MKIMYMGTPQFAARVLEIIHEEFSDAEFSAVTKPDTPKGRAYKLQSCETKLKALELGIPTFTPENLKKESFEEILTSFAPDVIIVAAYGKILPEYVLNFPKYGCVNVHGSLLPEYRGAAPVNRAIIDGKDETGVTIMYMEKGLDTGDMLAKSTAEIDNNTTASELFDTLAELGGKLMCETLHKIIDGTAKAEKQNDAESNYAEKITNADCAVNWKRSAFEIVRQIHGLSLEPGAVTRMPDGKLLKIFRAELSDEEFEEEAGTVVIAKKRIQVSCAKGSVKLLELQLEGGKKMSAADFINGRKIDVGMKFQAVE